ncbi:MFS transporter, partial [candidate division KSB1 bacterium]|nr:MFS transporter [candidate division KSB1 bacterium]
MLIIQLLFLLFLGLLDGQMLSPLLSALAADFKVSTAKMGSVVTAYACAASLCALVIGPLSDHWGRVIFLRAAALLFSLASVVAFYAPRFEIYLAARLLAGLAGGTISACVLSQIADSFTFQRRGRAMGWVGATYSLAAILGVPAAAWIAGGWSWRSIYFLLAFLPLPLVFSLQRPATNHVPAPREMLVRRTLNGYAHHWSNATTRRGLLLAAAISATAAALLTFLGAHLSAAFGMSIPAIGLVFLAAGLASALGALAGGALSDRLGKQRMVVLSSLALALLLPLFTKAQNTFQIYVMVGALGMFLAGREGPYQALISELVAPSQRGAYIALRNAASQLAI